MSASTLVRYALTEANVKDLIEWLRVGHINRAVVALENLIPSAAIKADAAQPQEPALPKEYCTVPYNSSTELRVFTEAQMREYGKLCRVNATPAVNAELLE